MLQPPYFQEFESTPKLKVSEGSLSHLKLIRRWCWRCQEQVFLGFGLRSLSWWKLGEFGEFGELGELGNWH